MPKKILMIVGDCSETLEVYCPLFTLRTMGFEVDIGCPNKTKGECVTSAVHDFSPVCQTFTEKPGHMVVVTCNLNDVNPKTYDGLYLPGGRAPEYLRMNPKVIECVKCFIECNKPIAAMCHGPQLLFSTFCMAGRKVTCFPTVAPECHLANCEYVKVPNDDCCVDNNIVSAPTWMATPKMLLCFTDMLGCKVTPTPTVTTCCMTGVPTTTTSMGMPTCPPSMVPPYCPPSHC